MDSKLREEILMLRKIHSTNVEKTIRSEVEHILNYVKENIKDEEVRMKIKTNFTCPQLEVPVSHDFESSDCRHDSIEKIMYVLKCDYHHVEYTGKYWRLYFKI
jgi:hypothetical protein